MRIKVSSSDTPGTVMTFDKVMSERAISNRDELSMLEGHLRFPKTLLSKLLSSLGVSN